MRRGSGAEIQGTRADAGIAVESGRLLSVSDRLTSTPVSFTLLTPEFTRQEESWRQRSPTTSGQRAPLEKGVGHLSLMVTKQDRQLAWKRLLRVVNQEGRIQPGVDPATGGIRIGVQEDLLGLPLERCYKQLPLYVA